MLFKNLFPVDVNSLKVSVISYTCNTERQRVLRFETKRTYLRPIIYAHTFHSVTFKADARFSFRFCARTYLRGFFGNGCSCASGVIVQVDAEQFPKNDLVGVRVAVVCWFGCVSVSSACNPFLYHVIIAHSISSDPKSATNEAIELFQSLANVGRAYKHKERPSLREGRCYIVHQN